jgi:hypothetical protein
MEHKIEIDYIVENIIKNHKKSHINYICNIDINGKESHLYDEDCVSRMLIKMYFIAKDENKDSIKKAILDLLKQMEKEPHAEENTEDIYTIGYLTALSRAELEIEKLIKKVD